VKALVSSGANINARNPESKNHTALHEAVIGGHKEVAKYLLDMGANQVMSRVMSLRYCSLPAVTT
jgi:ankyrin repeat protein